MARATTIRFTDEVYQRLDQASSRTGMPVNSIVVAACLEWMQRHTSEQGWQPVGPMSMGLPAAPRWATIRRALRQTGQGPVLYPFERFSGQAKKLLMHAQEEAEKESRSYIGTENLLLACFAEQEFQSRKILDAIGIDEASARTSVDTAGEGARPRWTRQFIPTARLKRIIEMAFNICSSMAQPRVSTGHILLALCEEGEGIGAHVLRDLGATPERIRQELERADLES
ncbi:MAG TPA: Clp protease N-terminal domain-containing protein [Candidatus Dormibacteraeota bacterium]|nr:Clp protease N-terminal domain-containing protein [Candidatus Dormibacteraeota bacterium]